MASHRSLGTAPKRAWLSYAGAAQPHTVDSVTTLRPGQPAAVDTFDYDATGNTTSRALAGQPGQTLSWDAEGHLSTVTENGQTTAEFVYDADGGRLLRKDPTAVTLYLEGQEIRLDRTTGARTTTRYYSHGGQVVAMRRGGTVTYLAADHQATNQIAIEASTQAVSRRRQLPFGAPRGGTSAWPDEKGFVGGTLDSATGLIHIGAREYDPAIGRFISVDPIMDLADPQQMHGYVYANNNPVTWSDPTGMIIHKSCPDGVCAPGQGIGAHQNAGANNPVHAYGNAPVVTNGRRGAGGARAAQEKRWRDTYERAVEDVNERHDWVRQALTDPYMQGSEASDIASSFVDERFCELIGDDCGTVFEYILSVSSVVVIGGFELRNTAGRNESSRIVGQAVERQLGRGWAELVQSNLSGAQREVYNNHLRNGRYYQARGLLGTALHNAVAGDLERGAHVGRFQYSSNRGPDFLDTKTGVRVELTTERAHPAHVARGGHYRGASYVLYRQPGLLPPAARRIGGR